MLIQATFSPSRIHCQAPDQRGLRQPARLSSITSSNLHSSTLSRPEPLGRPDPKPPITRPCFLRNHLETGAFSWSPSQQGGAGFGSPVLGPRPPTGAVQPSVTRAFDAEWQQDVVFALRSAAPATGLRVGRDRMRVEPL